MHLLGLLLIGKAAVIETAPVSAGDERVSCEVVFNRERGEFRVLTNMGRAIAEDVHADLVTLDSPRTGTHAYTSALGFVLLSKRGGEPS